MSSFIATLFPLALVTGAINGTGVDTALLMGSFPCRYGGDSPAEMKAILIVQLGDATSISVELQQATSLAGVYTRHPASAPGGILVTTVVQSFNVLDLPVASTLRFLRVVVLGIAGQTNGALVSAHVMWNPTP